ncbi:MAG: hypothetical protein NBV60_09035 [Erythrobacter sp.]|nr:hypothetical protein [Erythrobacter sp.]
MVLPVLVLQRWYVSHLDRTLPKRWRRLPTLSVYGVRRAAPRRAALYDGFQFTLLMSAMLVGLAIWFDLQQRPFALGKTLLSNGCGLALACVYYGRGVFFVRRWIRTGKPPIRGLRHPTDKRD